ncbi:hypothetical protein CTI12_AA595650 [Artemisia annua]|uniref:SOSEKI DIX-like domain-containing protein n=1 Tax=Artemisia annua TaxID=35608 RepID=A0A2U1KJC5_ARTAN|nr:hypothetical protein CTI12_AA595650 [Artemisia annua]
MSKMSDELLIHRKSWSSCSNHKPGNARPVIHNHSSGYSSPVWSEPKGVVPARKVAVLYYISRNGHLEHPHLIDVPMSSPHGLYLKDVMKTLNQHRGKGMANMYSWSFKRSYKNGYVWQDVSKDDLIQPTNGQDYIIKGSELLNTHISPNQSETMVIRRNRSWSSFDNPQQAGLAHKCESNRELAAKFAPDATEGPRREQVTDEILSPPPSNSSSEASVVMSRSRYVDERVKVRDPDPTVEDQHATSGRMKASHVLMHLITCGTDSVKNVSPL